MQERREHQRFPARWRVSVICDCKRQEHSNTQQGMTGDLSLGGATILTKHNFCARKEVLIILDIPPDHTGGAITRLQIRARTSYTVLDGSLHLFRSGIEFVDMSPADRKRLEHHLSRRFTCLGGAAGKTPPAPKR